jgi:hypothetical protein
LTGHEIDLTLIRLRGSELLSSSQRFTNNHTMLRGGQEGAPHVRNVASGAGAVQSRSGEGAKRDFPDTERLVKRLLANELTLSFVLDTEQRLWRTVTRRRYQQTCDKVRSQNQLEALPEEAQLKLSPKFCAVRLTGRASRNGKCRSIYLTFSRFHG